MLILTLKHPDDIKCCLTFFASMKLTQIFLLLLLLGQTYFLPAQELFSEPTAKLKTRVPFVTLSGGVILLKATVNNYPDSLNFILDTGSGGISLDSSTCESLKIPLVATDRTIR